MKGSFQGLKVKTVEEYNRKEDFKDSTSLISIFQRASI
jgi:hypothetical protein